jgi:Rap guanine nucleotide exchange factor 1
MAVFAELNSVMDTKLNFQNYRESLAAREPPVLPFQGVLLQDLTFIEENPDRTPSGAVNFEKMQMLGRLLGELKAYRRVRYRFTPVPVLAMFLLEVKPMSEDQLWTSSRMCEPTIQEQESPAPVRSSG